MEPRPRPRKSFNLVELRSRKFFDFMEPDLEKSFDLVESRPRKEF